MLLISGGLSISVVLVAYGNSVFKLILSRTVNGIRSGFSSHFWDVGLSGYSKPSRSISDGRPPPFLFPFPGALPTLPPPPPNSPESIPNPPPPMPFPELPELDELLPLLDDDIVLPLPFVFMTERSTKEGMPKHFGTQRVAGGWLG